MSWMHYSRCFQTRRPKAQYGVHCIEGETLRLDVIAERLDVSPRIARHRIINARRVAGKEPVTWKLLGLKDEVTS